MKSARIVLISLGTIALCCAPYATAAKEEVLYSFPAGSYVFGRPKEAGNAHTLYGTAYHQNGQGTIYRLKKNRDGWNFDIVYAFDQGSGKWPVAGLIEDPSTGTFFGSTTQRGGSDYDGTIFSFVPSRSGGEYSVLYRFTGGSDGRGPVAPLFRDKTTGVLFGTNATGSTANCGTVFRLSPSGSSWTFSTLHIFNNSDGCQSLSQLEKVPNRDELIGTTWVGGANNGGNVFSVTQAGNFEVIHDFAGGADGANPEDLDIAEDGTAYGVTGVGGQTGAGVVFQLVSNGTNWTYSVIYNFQGGNDGRFPSGIRFDRATDAIYGCTSAGGTFDEGTIFKLTFDGTSWTKTILHNFTGGSDGSTPYSRPLVDSRTSVIYGTTAYGGAYDGGIVYKVTQRK